MPSSQDTSRNPQSRPRRKKIDPCHAHIQDLAAYLATNLEDGLSPKEAEKRFLRREVGGLFHMEKPKLRTCILPILKEPVMWLLVAVCVIACIFDRGDIGFYGLLLLLFHGVVCVLLGRATQRLEMQMQTYDVPLTRVVRNHRLLRVPADKIVPGDIILLRQGDVVPADARLLTSRHLVVDEDTLDGDAARRRTIRLEKDARQMPKQIPQQHSPIHMVYAGSLVVEGEGRALVTAAGQRTHLGGLLGKIPVSHENHPPKNLVQSRKTLSFVNLLLAVACVPLTVIGILTLGAQYDLLDLFAATLALSVLTLTEHMVVYGAYLSTSLRHFASHHPDAHLSCEIRHTETLEKLRQMDHLVLMGTAALHDGVFMPDAILTCDNTYTCGQSATDSAITYFAEKMFLYAEGFKSLDEKLASAVDKITAWAQPDEETLMLRLSAIEVQEDGVKVVMKRSHPTYLYLEPVHGQTVDLTAYPWMRCLTRDGNGQACAPLTGDTVLAWREWVCAAEKQSKRVFMLVSETQGEWCVEGLISFAPETSPKTKGILSAFMAAGIDVTVFLSCDDMWNHTGHLYEAGLLHGREAPYVLHSETSDELFALAEQGVRVFANCLPQDAVDYITLLQKNGGVVGVLSVEERDVEVLSVADIAMTCCPVDLKDALINQAPVSTSHILEADGDSDGDMSTDISRYTSDVVVRRASRYGGGVCGVRQALLTAEQMQKSARDFCRYVILSQILRVLMVCIPLIVGLTVISTPTVLFSGFVMDLVAFWCFAKADVPTELTSRRMEKVDAQKTMPENTKKHIWHGLPVQIPELVAVGVSVLIPWIVAFIAKLLHVKFGADLGYFGMLSLLGSQIALMLTFKRPRRRRLGFFLVVVMICLYVGGLAIALAAQLSVFWCLLMPLVQPLILFVALQIIHKVQARHRV